MGDRTFVTIRLGRNLTPEQKAKAAEILEIDETSDCQILSGLEDWEDEECNYGGSEYSDALENAGIPMHIQWGKGGNYDAGERIYDGKQVSEIECNDSHWLVAIDRNGSPAAGAVREAKLFAQMHKEFYKFKKEKE